MEGDLERSSKRMLVVGVLFAAVGILALLLALMEPEVRDERERSAKEIFNPEYTVAEKAEILATISASSTGATISEEDKLRVLESLRSQ